MSWAKVSRVRLRSPSEGTNKLPPQKKRGSHGKEIKANKLHRYVWTILLKTSWQSAESPSGLQEYTWCNSVSINSTKRGLFPLPSSSYTGTHFLNKEADNDTSSASDDPPPSSSSTTLNRSRVKLERHTSGLKCETHGNVKNFFFLKGWSIS